jgi:hypothetical protein
VRGDSRRTAVRGIASDHLRRRVPAGTLSKLPGTWWFVGRPTYVDGARRNVRRARERNRSVAMPAPTTPAAPRTGPPSRREPTPRDPWPGCGPAPRSAAQRRQSVASLDRDHHAPSTEGDHPTELHQDLCAPHVVDCRCTRSTTSSAISLCVAWPHQTSRSSSTSSVRACSVRRALRSAPRHGQRGSPRSRRRS